MRPIKKKPGKSLLQRLAEFILGKKEEEETEIVGVPPKKEKRPEKKKKTDWSKFKSFTEEATED